MKKHHTLFVIFASIIFLWIFFQYKSQRDSHYRLVNQGIETEIEAQIAVTNGIHYITYWFKTQKEQPIKRTQKCGSQTDCERYQDATIIYNPQNIEEFEFSFEFYSYSEAWRFFFFFFLYLPILILACWYLAKFLEKELS